MRYEVDPAELQAAAGRMGRGAEAALEARAHVLAAADTLHAWCPAEVRGTVGAAIEALAHAALLAGHHGQLTARRLTRAAEGYAVADHQVAQ